MGTRSTYRVRSTYMKRRDDKPKVRHTKDLCLVYRQFDGYPSGHPSEIAKWLSGGKVVNGIGMDDAKKLVFNGAGCLAAQLIAKFKEDSPGAGGTYVEPLKSRGTCWEEYLYDIVVDAETHEVTFIAYENYGKRPKQIFKGKPEDFEAYILSTKEKEA